MFTVAKIAVIQPHRVFFFFFFSFKTILKISIYVERGGRDDSESCSHSWEYMNPTLFFLFFFSSNRLPSLGRTGVELKMADYFFHCLTPYESSPTFGAFFRRVDRTLVGTKNGRDYFRRRSRDQGRCGHRRRISPTSLNMSNRSENKWP